MMSYQIAIPKTRRAAARFIQQVRAQLLRAVAEADVSQADIARELGVNRSVVNRELRGTSDLSLGRVAEIAVILGCLPKLTLENLSVVAGGANRPSFEVRSTAKNVSRVSATPLTSVMVSGDP